MKKKKIKKLDTKGWEQRKTILEAVARGWCSKKNENKIMDSDLANAITDEILALLSSQLEEVAEKVEGMKKEIPNPQGYSMNGARIQQEEKGYNQAIDEVLAYLRRIK